MDIQELRSKIKPTTAIFMTWFLFGSHYAYLGKWGTQILFWLTLGGLGIWAAYDLINMTEIITRHRESIFQKIEEIEMKNKIKIPAQSKLQPAPRYRYKMVG